MFFVFSTFMKNYVPNLITARHRVLPDYFKESSRNKGNSTTSFGSFLWNILALAVTVAALFTWGTHLGFSLSLLAFAFFVSDWGRRMLELKLQFYFTSSLKAGIWGVTLLLSVLTGFQYKGRIDLDNEKLRLAVVEKQKAEAEFNRKETLRIDSLRGYLSLAEASLKKGSYAKAIRLYNHSARFATANESADQRRLHEGLALSYVHIKAYQSAIEHYNGLNSLNDEQLYQRALCYLRLGLKSEALSDLSGAAEAGNKTAAKLYEKENPLLRRVLYYQTVCCDGSYSPSNAKGRGACSHHGGVCDWNKPIYETYRKYDVSSL